MDQELKQIRTKFSKCQNLKFIFYFVLYINTKEIVYKYFCRIHAGMPMLNILLNIITKIGFNVYRGGLFATIHIKFCFEIHYMLEIIIKISFNHAIIFKQQMGEVVHKFHQNVTFDIVDYHHPS